MQEFVGLRKKAKDIRDKAIEHARAEYEATLVSIAKLEQDLTGRESSRHKRISACIESVIPNDREFTTVDIMTALEAKDPGRVWRKRSVDNHLYQLRERGLIRRTKRARSTGEPAIYCRHDAKVQTRPFDDRRLVDIVADYISERPMTQTELTVAIMEAGYETSMTKPMLRNHIGMLLRGDAGRFQKDGSDKWQIT